jgi:hypothetical protein
MVGFIEDNEQLLLCRLQELLKLRVPVLVRLSDGLECPDDHIIVGPDVDGAVMPCGAGYHTGHQSRLWLGNLANSVTKGKECLFQQVVGVCQPENFVAI